LGDTFKYWKTIYICRYVESTKVNHVIRLMVKGKKAVSPVIAVVLMIAVAVAIAVIVYAWSTGFVSKRSSIESAESEQLVIEEMNLSGTQLTVYVRNKIAEDAVVNTIYVNGQARAVNLAAIIPAKSVTLLDISALITSQGGNGNIIIGDTVNLATLRGTQIKFIVK
jgi:flagellin-like protein